MHMCLEDDLDRGGTGSYHTKWSTECNVSLHFGLCFILFPFEAGHLYYMYLPWVLSLKD